MQETEQFDPLAVEIGQKIGHYRRERRIAQTTLGGLIGVSHETMRSIERGKYPPRSDALVKIAAVLGIPVEQLMPADYLKRFNPLTTLAAQIAAIKATWGDLDTDSPRSSTPLNDVPRILLKAGETQVA